MSPRQGTREISIVEVGARQAKGQQTISLGMRLRAMEPEPKAGWDGLKEKREGEIRSGEKGKMTPTYGQGAGLVWDGGKVQPPRSSTIPHGEPSPSPPAKLLLLPTT